MQTVFLRVCGIAMLEVYVTMWGVICINCKSQSFGLGGIVIGLWHCHLGSASFYCCTIKTAPPCIVKRAAAMFIAIVIWAKKITDGTLQSKDAAADYLGSIWRLLAFPHGEGNGNPLQCSCLENPRDWGAWWAAVYGVAQSRTQLKRLSSSSSSISTQRRQWQPTPVLLPGQSHGQRSLVGCSPWGHEESDTKEWLHSHFSLSCIGEGYGNPLQCSCLENPRDRGAWWAAVYGVAQSWTRLKRQQQQRHFHKAGNM